VREKTDMAIKVRHLTPQENKQWDGLIEGSPQGEIFLLSFFLSAWQENDPRIHLLRLGCFDKENRLVGGQAFLYKKKLGVLPEQILLQTWTHIETPVIAGSIIPGSPHYFEIMGALAEKGKRISFYYKVFCHRTIQDVRPFLKSGWRARPDYAHAWDLHNVETTLQELNTKKRFRNTKKVFQDLQFTCAKNEEIIDEFVPFYLMTAKSIGYVLRESFEQIFRVMAIEMLRRDILRFITCRKKTGELVAIATYTINPAKKTAYGWQLAHVPLQREMDIIPALYLYSIKVLSEEVNFIDIAEGLHSSLYLYKDSLGTKSTRHFVLETPHASTWLKIVGIIRRGKQKMVSLTR
jgi:hypothetical protein